MCVVVVLIKWVVVAWIAFSLFAPFVIDSKYYAYDACDDKKTTIIQMV